ncbi:piezo-type mechanosensitive ion channel component 1 isoform X2 [Leucoraja erinacea]|uniref:piezo-type mechanosensitive ion channel component 1 isoform X2 n=1 Tax=Leucoraja erinaceus TaxID=7782 RepID=UPI0024550B75|nr:piezo-type mechanosensitive ion channel component 1 isoform X2 [Leucoraja erinacea]
MEVQVMCCLCYWLLLPLSLLAACLFRYNALSLIYLLYLLLLPLFFGPSEHTVRGHTGRLLKALLATSILFLCAQGGFQVALYVLKDEDLLGYNCSTWETLSRHIGVTRLNLNDIANSVRLVAPDLGIFIISCITLVFCSRLTKRRKSILSKDAVSSEEEDVEEEGSELEDAAEDEEDAAEQERRRQARLAALARLRTAAQKLLEATGKIVAILLLALAGITVPSAFSGVYYLLFIGICTWWACHFPMSRIGFNTICVMVAFYTAGHIICLYIYQSAFIQEMFPSDGLWSRLFGLKDIIHSNCSHPHELVLNVNHTWPAFANFAVLLLLYYTVASLLKLKKKTGPTDVARKNGEDVELVNLEPWSMKQNESEDEAKPMLQPAGEGHGEGDSDIVHVIGGPGQPDAVETLNHPPTLAPRYSHSLLHGLGHVMMQQSYICALIIMMVWSITFHSWLTFVLLIWACLIWIVRSRRHLALFCSPFILLYGILLCSLHYVWGMDLTEELPTKIGFVVLKQLGLAHRKDHCLSLGVMLLYTLTFWLLLRQFVKEKCLKHKEVLLKEVTVPEPGQEKNDVLKLLGELVMSFYAKYWIYICGGMFFVVSFTGRIVVYKIVYMFLFLLCLSFYQVCYFLWRKLLKLFWWLVVAYTMLVLISVYTFQFDDFPHYWMNITGLTEKQLGDMGLEKFGVSELFSSILIPAFFLLSCILQLHYFHRCFMQITDLEHVPTKGSGPLHRLKENLVARSEEAAELLGNGAAEGTDSEDNERPVAEESRLEGEIAGNKWGLVIDRLLVLFLKFSKVLNSIQVKIWRLLELHMMKLVALFSVWVALKEPSVMNFLFIVLWAFAMPFAKFRPMASCLSTLWVCIIVVCKMLYQLKIVNPAEYSSNCTAHSPNETNLKADEIMHSGLYRGPIDPANWFGFRKEFPVLAYLQDHLLLLMLLVFEITVYRHQEHYRKYNQMARPTTSTLFPEITRQHLDQSVASCAKYFSNFFFYKFGLEVCLIMTVNVIGQRMNFLAIIHACWLIAVVTRRRRQAIARLWPKYCIFQSLFLLCQYLLCLGIPPALCLDYPWRWPSPITIHSSLIKWFYLPDFVVTPSSKHLFYDFLLLMCSSHQWQVFIDERKEEVNTKAGENTDNPDPMTGKDLNPVPNFLYCRCYLDMIKAVVFRYLFWLVAAVIFAAGSTRISVFGLGYLLASFYLLLLGRRLLLKPAASRLNFWDCLIMYNITVMIAKNMLSLLACVFLKQLQSNFCWMIQLLSLHCTIKGYYNENDLKDPGCSLPVGEAGVLWDSICFFFLLLQRRVFLSYYFIHVTADMRASKLQASRGFQLFNASIIKNMNFLCETEMKSKAQIKRQMERIRGKQEKYRRGERNPNDPSEKDEEDKEQSATTEKSQEKRKWWHPWANHTKVLQSGDYYLFESDSEEDEGCVQEEQKPPEHSAFQMAYQAWVTNAKLALKNRKEHKKLLQKFKLDAETHRRSLKGVKERDEVLQQEPSNEEEVEEEDEEEEEEEIKSKANAIQRLTYILKFLWVLFLAMVDGLTQWLNTVAKQYLDTFTVLWIERYLLTQKLAQGEGMQEPQAGFIETSDNRPQQPNMDPEDITAGSSPQLNTTPSNSEEEQEALATCDKSKAVPESSKIKGIEEQSLAVDSLESAESVTVSEETNVYPIARTETASELLASSHYYIEELEESEKFYDSQNRLLKLLFAMYYVVAAKSELACYFIIILNNLTSASVITLFLPILMFLWAMLSIPRPSKRFWMTAIIYTEVMVVIKYLFQFGFFPWNSPHVALLYEDKPFFPPRILGLEKMESYVKYDLIQLLALLFHQSLLKRYGLWDDQEDQKKKDNAKDKEAVQKPPAVSLDDAAAEDDHISVLQPEQEVTKPGFLFRRRKQAKVKESSSRKPRKKRTKKEKASKKLREFWMKLKNFLFKMVQSICRPLRNYFYNVLHTKYRAATDVYALMFLADVVDFVIIIFGFWAFGKHSAAADIASTLSDDQVPEAFLVMVLVQFSTMVIDRALYLRKTLLGKLVFQIILVLGIHFWMFFILPAVTERMFNQNTVVQLWYFVKCIYFALSAYQIRCGYPTRILGNFLTKKYNHVNLFLFQGFRLVPFLVELRAVMDWVCTDTTLSLSNWMCVEDIYANIFIIKCSRETEKRYPQPKGQKKKKIVKYGMGGLIILFLICIIWFPLLFMSLVRSVVGVVNHPVDVTVTVKLGGYQPLFTMSAQQHSLKPFDQKDYDNLCSMFERNPAAMQFISLYGYKDIMTAHIEGSSGSLWSVSPPSRQAMITELKSNESVMTLRLMWNFQRNLSLGGVQEHASEKHNIDLEPENPVREQLAGLLLGTRKEPVLISHMLPKYIRAPNGPDANPVEQINSEHENNYLNVTMELQRHVGRNANDPDGILEWWVIQTKTEECKQNECNELQMVIFSDKVSPPSLGFLAGHGIMGLYISIVLVVGKFVRGFFSEISYSIMFEELPCVNRILKLCHDIFLVRENGELEVEEELYAKLIFLYRSPETMIKWTREKD